MPARGAPRARALSGQPGRAADRLREEHGELVGIAMCRAQAQEQGRQRQAVQHRLQHPRRRRARRRVRREQRQQPGQAQSVRCTCRKRLRRCSAISRRNVASIVAGAQRGKHGGLHHPACASAGSKRAKGNASSSRDGGSSRAARPRSSTRQRSACPFHSPSRCVATSTVAPRRAAARSSACRSAAPVRIQAEAGFVEHEHRRVGQREHREREPLTRAARQPPGRLRAHLGEAPLRFDRLDARRGQAAQPGVEREDLAGGEPRVEAGRLRQERELRQRRHSRRGRDPTCRSRCARRRASTGRTAGAASSSCRTRSRRRAA